MDDKKLNNILNEIEDFQSTSTRCNDLQKIINYCRENYDYWREIKLSYSFSYYHNNSISFDINDFNLDMRNRVLEFICNENKNSDFTVSDLENLLNFIKLEDQNWGDILITCEDYYNPVSCYVDENLRSLCFISS